MVIIISNSYRKGHFFASYWKIMATHAKSTLLALLAEGIGGGGEGGGGRFYLQIFEKLIMS